MISLAHELVAQRAAYARTAGADMPSPCISVCMMSPDTGLCLGCWRTIDEIAAWSRLDVEARRTIWARIEQRAAISEEQ